MNQNIHFANKKILHFRYVLPVVEADATSWVSDTRAGEPTSWSDSWVSIQHLNDINMLNV